jgi:uncharacterized membrane protein YkvA (DUF1232 family)
MKKKPEKKALSTKIKKQTADYSDDRFWNKVTLYAATAGVEVIEKALWLYYAAQKPNTPKWARRSIYGALFYFINPFDLLADLTPLLGFSDDLAILALAVTTVALYIDDDVKKKADDKLREWFPPTP